MEGVEGGRRRANGREGRGRGEGGLGCLWLAKYGIGSQPSRVSFYPNLQSCA